jgi:hypothetical protein
MGHSDTGDADAGAECLTCRLRDIAMLYFPPFGNRSELYNRLNAFDAQIGHEFWGERSKLWKTGVKLGTEDGIGGSAPVSVSWLVRTLHQQMYVVNRDGVSEYDLLKHIFWLTVRVYLKCTKGHRTWVSRKGYLLLRMEGRTGDSRIVADGLKNLFSGFIKVCDLCGNKDSRAAAIPVPDIELTNLPEIIMIGTPKRAVTKQTKIHFTF